MNYKETLEKILLLCTENETSSELVGRVDKLAADALSCPESQEIKDWHTTTAKAAEFAEQKKGIEESFRNLAAPLEEQSIEKMSDKFFERCKIKWVKVSERLPEFAGVYKTQRAHDAPDTEGVSFFDGVQFPNYDGYKVLEWLDEFPSDPVDQEEEQEQEFEHTERYETRLMLHRLIKWAKSVEGSKAHLLIENCQKILNKWGNVEDALRSSEPVQGVEQEEMWEDVYDLANEKIEIEFKNVMTRKYIISKI